MSAPIDMPSTRRVSGGSPGMSPVGSPGSFLLPSPIPCKRTRTYSACERASQGPSFTGKMQSFCRERGHGFIIPEDGSDKLFVHISDIDGDYVPKAGDIVSYKKIAIPPKNEKFSAVHVKIQQLAEGDKHETWDAPVHRN